jgi:hypothetical protein
VIAALFVETNGIYYNRPNVDPWDEARDARLYEGPWPVVAHPPCARWCRLAGLVEARWGHKRGDDGGCFASALKFVRQFGGVLEHPAYSDAWKKFNLPVPASEGWTRDFCGGWSARIEQVKYGHVAKKATWLYAFGVELPSLRWGKTADRESAAVVSWCRNHTNKFDVRQRIGKKKAAATPPDFAEVLIAMAESAYQRRLREES